MNEVIKWASRAGAVILAWLCQALGGWDAALGLLFLVMGLDLLTGILCAFHQKSDKTQGGGLPLPQLLPGPHAQADDAGPGDAGHSPGQYDGLGRGGQAGRDRFLRGQ